MRRLAEHAGQHEGEVAGVAGRGRVDDLAGEQPVAARLDEQPAQAGPVLVDHGAGDGEAHGQTSARPTVDLVTRIADPFASTVQPQMFLGLGAVVRKNRETSEFGRRWTTLEDVLAV